MYLFLEFLPVIAKTDSNMLQVEKIFHFTPFRTIHPIKCFTIVDHTIF